MVDWLYCLLGWAVIKKCISNKPFWSTYECFVNSLVSSLLLFSFASFSSDIHDLPTRWTNYIHMRGEKYFWADLACSRTSMIKANDRDWIDDDHPSSHARTDLLRLDRENLLGKSPFVSSSTQSCVRALQMSMTWWRTRLCLEWRTRLHLLLHWLFFHFFKLQLTPRTKSTAKNDQIKKKTDLKSPELREIFCANSYWS